MQCLPPVFGTLLLCTRYCEWSVLCNGKGLARETSFTCSTGIMVGYLLVFILGCYRDFSHVTSAIHYRLFLFSLQVTLRTVSYRRTLAATTTTDTPLSVFSYVMIQLLAYLTIRFFSQCWSKWLTSSAKSGWLVLVIVYTIWTFYTQFNLYSL